MTQVSLGNEQTCSARRHAARSFRFLVNLAAAGLLLLNLIALAPTSFWLIDLTKNFQSQYFMSGMLMLVVALAARRWRCAIASIIVIAIGSAQLAPLYFGGGARHQMGRATVVRVMTANAETEFANPPMLQAAIDQIDPDVIGLNEVGTSLHPMFDQLHERYPFGMVELRDDHAGLALISRLPLENVRSQKIGSSHFSIISAEMSLDGQTVRLIAAHTHSPQSWLAANYRDHELHDLAAFIADHPTSDSTRTILMGDLNATMWSSAYGSLVTTAHLQSARDGHGILPTWPTWLPALMRIPIDHCLCGEKIEITRCWIGPDTGSDHLPFVAEIACGR